jgi:hypothetical protein
MSGGGVVRDEIPDSAKTIFKICKQRLIRNRPAATLCLKSLKKIKSGIFPVGLFGGIKRTRYLCIVFFMVLDLRLTMKIGCRETTISFLCKPVNLEPDHR